MKTYDIPKMNHNKFVLNSTTNKIAFIRITDSQVAGNDDAKITISFLILIFSKVVYLASLSIWNVFKI